MRHFPINLQFFAAPDGGAGSGDGGEGNQNNQQQNNNQPGNNQQTGTQSFDYDKLASIIAGKQSVTEDTVLKNYFKQQGLSQEEMNQAISSFKEQKAKNTPDVAGIQSQLTQSQQANQKLQIQNVAQLQAIKAGIAADTVPYVLKLADFSTVMGTDGKINDEEVKKAIDKVLEDVPALKPSNESSSGFQVGAPGSNSNNNNESQDEMLRGIFGIKKK